MDCPSKDKLTQDFVRSVFDYQDGHLCWKVSPYKPFGRAAGSKAGHQTQYYTAVDIYPWSFSEANLVILWHTGTIPRKRAKHKNGDRYDNHIENLTWTDMEGVWHNGAE